MSTKKSAKAKTKKASSKGCQPAASSEKSMSIGSAAHTHDHLDGEALLIGALGATALEATSEADVLIQAGHEGRTSGATGAEGPLGKEIEWTPIVADEATRLLRAAGVTVIRAKAALDGPYTVKIATFIHFDGGGGASKASIGYNDDSDKPAATAWKTLYGRHWPFGFMDDNFTANLRSYYGYSHTRTSDAEFVIELGDIDGLDQARWLKPRLRWIGKLLAHFLSDRLGKGNVPHPGDFNEGAPAAIAQAATPRRAAKRAAGGESDPTIDPSSQVIVIPPRSSFITSMASSFRGMAGALSSTALESGPKTLRGILEARRDHLHAFAASVMSSASGLSGAMTMEAASTGGRSRRGNRAPTGESGTQVLEALGVLIMERASVDCAALRGSFGATVIENFLIPLEYPVSGGAEISIAPGGANGLDLWHLTNINVNSARAKGLTGKGVLVGVLDTGIDHNHPEFAQKAVHFAEFDQSGRKISVRHRDAGSHGTHVSGIIAGNTVGVAPDAGLAVAAVLTIPTPRGLSGYFAQILGGMNWLLSTDFTGDEDNPGVDVMNASLGGVGYNDYYYQTLANARVTTGTLLVAAIGNSGPGVNLHGSPGNYDISVGTGAIDRNNDIASFSDWGTVSQHGGLSKPDICAPGADVVSSMPGGSYAPMSGTSMATPVVAGALALLLQEDPALELDAMGLEARLYSLATPLSGAANRRRDGRGRLDLSRI